MGTRSRLSLLAVFLGAAQLCFADTVAAPGKTLTVTLEDEVYVKGPRVLLGEVAHLDGDRAGEMAELELVSAPLPGNTTRVLASLVSSRIRNAGLSQELFEVQGARQVRATTLHQEISGTDLGEDLRNYLLLEMPWDPAKATVDVTAPKYDVVIPEGDLTITWQANPQWRYLGTGAFRGEIAVDGKRHKTVAARATIEAYGDVIVAATDIPRGSVVALRDLAVEQRPLSTMKRGVISDPAEVVGQVARSTIFPGKLLTRRSVAAPILVRRYQTVIVEIQTGPLMVRTSARAKDNGGVGDVISCMNPDTKEILHGVIRKDGVVVIK
jgi:flagella basal body P-ring formation protein FlgA